VRTLQLGREHGEWKLGPAVMNAVVSFVPSGDGANVVLLSRIHEVTLTGRRLKPGAVYPLRNGDRVQVEDVVVRFSGSGGAYPTAGGSWVHLAGLLGVVALCAWAVVQVSGGPLSPQLEAAPEDPPVAVDPDQRIKRQALAEAAGLERLRAYERAAAVLERAAAQVKDPQAKRELNARRAGLIGQAAKAAAEQIGRADPLEEVPTPEEAAEVPEPEEVEAPDPELQEPEAPDPEAKGPGPVPPSPAPKVEVDPFLHAVSEAIDRGVDYLSTQTDSLNRPGLYALLAFALLRSGVSPHDPRMVSLFSGFEDQVMDQTYDIAVSIMAIEARSVERVSIAALPGATSVARFRRRDLPPEDLARISSLAQQLIGGQHPAGNWGYTCPLNETTAEPFRATGGDNSNTQFAVLALHAAQRSGVSVPIRCWVKVIEHYKQDVHEEKPARSVHALGFDRYVPPVLAPLVGAPGAEVTQGWGYTTPASPSPSLQMTSGGISSIVIALDALQRAGDLDPALGAAALELVARGAAKLAHVFSIRGKPPSAGANKEYLLYSLEKAMEVSGIERLGGADWYRGSATMLVRRQQKDGSWTSVWGSALALLVLNRATLRLTEGTRVRGAGSSADARPLVVEVRGKPVNLLERLRVLAELGTPRKEISILRQAIKALARQDRPRLVVELSALVGSEEQATDRFARKQLREIVGADLDPSEYRDWGRSYVRLYEVGRWLDADTRRALQGVLAGDAGGPLLEVAVSAAVRGGGLEVVPALVDALWRAKGQDHETVCSGLRALTGEDPASDSPDPAQAGAAWRAWLRENAETLRFRQLIETFAQARPGAVEARAELLGLDPEQVVPPLLEAFALDPESSWIPPLLAELTGLGEVEPTPGAWRIAWEARAR